MAIGPGKPPFETELFGQEERQTFKGSHGSMTQGWTGTFEQPAEYLAKA